MIVFFSLIVFTFIVMPISVYADNTTSMEEIISKGEVNSDVDRIRLEIIKF